MKASLYKHSGNKEFASELYDEARHLDEADRFLNARSSRYKLRVDKIDEAERTMAAFSKETPNGELNVHEM